MPICPRCGKCLSSEQALTYHLNKKYKCGTWKCSKCDMNFGTKLDLNLHQMACCGYRIDSPPFDVLQKIYNEINTPIVQVDDSNIIHNVNPAYLKTTNLTQKQIIGSVLTNCSNNVYVYKVH